MPVLNTVGAVLLLLGSFLVIRALWIADFRGEADAATPDHQPNEPSFPKAA